MAVAIAAAVVGIRLERPPHPYRDCPPARCVQLCYFRRVSRQVEIHPESLKSPLEKLVYWGHSRNHGSAAVALRQRLMRANARFGSCGAMPPGWKHEAGKFPHACGN